MASHGRSLWLLYLPRRREALPSANGGAQSARRTTSTASTKGIRMSEPLTTEQPFDPLKWLHASWIATGDRKYLETKRELEYWRKDSATAWDKCEEHRLEVERLKAVLDDATRGYLPQ